MGGSYSGSGGSRDRLPSVIAVLLAIVELQRGQYSYLVFLFELERVVGQAKKRVEVIKSAYHFSQ